MPVILFPLLFVVLVNGLKDFIEDFKRKKSDNRENSTKVECFGTQIILDQKGNQINSDPTLPLIRTKKWEELSVGDIIKVKKNDYFPADLILLYSPNPNGVAFVETKSLDGETNLKFKESLRATYNALNKIDECNRESEVKNIFGIVDCDEPNASMYNFDGIYIFDSKLDQSNRISQKDILEIKNNGLELEERERTLTSDLKFNFSDNNVGAPLNLEYNNILLRGSSLKNTEYIYGVVVYAGHNSKIMLNSLVSRSKQSKVFKIMNRQLLYIILFQFSITLIFAIFYAVNLDPYQGVFYSKDKVNVGFVKFLYSYGTWILATCNLVPISLLVTLEMIKFCQAYFITHDFKLYDKLNKRTATVQSSSLNEELGQVQHIFTDKTGTLTKNIMQFKYMVIGDTLYGSDNHIDPKEVKDKKITNVDFKDPKFFDDWTNGKRNCDNITNFIFTLALCHTIIVEIKDEDTIYNASSPDELALVNAAKYFGIEFIERSADSIITIKYNNNLIKFELLNIFEFDSDRKRMSVVIKLSDGTIKLLCKGADNIISERLDKHKGNTEKVKITYYLEEFGRKGLRTLMIAEKIIDPEEYLNFKKLYKNSLVSGLQKKEKLAEAYSNLEINMTLLGVTAIEDCLQDDLKPTLKAFGKIGINIWMLTGDHPFTAVSIAHSCGLINKSFHIIMNIIPQEPEILIELNSIFEHSKDKKFCLVLTGDVISLILSDHSKEMFIKFKECILLANSVICSRVTPKQKAELVLLVKSLNPSKTTLSIGDGANDVNMITSADVGIGILGNEGQQAARSSDYVIGQFSYLKRLLFVHGREAYRKNSFAIGYVLWKNFMYVVPIIM